MTIPHEHIMQFFVYDHLPPAAQAVSKPFCELAQWIEQTLPRNPERTVALRKVLEAKDAGVRASLAKPLPEHERRERQEIKPADVADVSSVLGATAESKPDVP